MQSDDDNSVDTPEENPSTTTDDSPAESDDKPADDQPSEPSDDKPADDQPADQSDDKPADDKPTDDQPSDDKPADDQPTGQSDDQPAGQSDDQPSGQTDDQPSGQTDEQAAAQGDTPVQQAGGESAQKSDGDGNVSGQPGTARRSMIDLVNKWMPTSLSSPKVPKGETQDLLAKAGWTKATGENSKKVKDSGGHPATSCGDVLSTLLKLWGSGFTGAFNIRDTDSTGHGPGAKKLGYYVDASQLSMEGDVVKSPKPGDILVLRNGVGPGSVGSVGHVGILVEATKDKWRTADGGGGQLPDQTAAITDRAVRWENSIPILKSPTDLKEKQLDGWVDLDKLPRSK